MPHSFRSSRSLVMFALLACVPDKQGDTDASTGSSGTSGTSEPTTSSSTTTASSTTTSGEPTTTAEPITTSSTGTETATDSGGPSTTTGTGVTDTDSTDTSGMLPIGDCDEQLNPVDCEAIIGPGGHSDCVWVETVAQWSQDGGCDLVAGPARCIQGRYVGDGCFGSGCPDLDRVYIRDLGDGTFDIVNHPGGTCGVEPDGWKQCYDENPEPPEACSCVC